MMRLHEYSNEVFDISEKNGVDMSVGASMFLRNVYDGKETYKGSKTAVDWASLKPHYAEFCHSYYSWGQVIWKNRSKIVALIKADDRAGLKAFFAAH